MSALLLTLITAAGVAVGFVGHDSNWTAPAKAAARVNPLANRQELSGGGRKVFGQRCAECHGDDARGTNRAPNLTAPDIQAQSDGELFWKISTGNAHAGMPTFSNLPEAQRWQLVLFIRLAARPER